uniref:Uncharacterized protein n=1 Tax=Arundo donax TaxID=35708 RepID=A0A0A9A2W6_ARUDO
MRKQSSSQMRNRELGMRE